MTPMSESSGQNYITIKVYRETRQKLRLLSVLTEKQIAVVVDELVTRELEKAQKQKKPGK